MGLSFALEQNDLHALLHTRIGMMKTFPDQCLLDFLSKNESSHPCTSARPPQGDVAADPRRPPWFRFHLPDSPCFVARAICVTSLRVEYTWVAIPRIAAAPGGFPIVLVFCKC